VQTIDRVMRIMTQVDTGAALVITAWLLWSGYQVVSGQWEPQWPAPATPQRPADEAPRPVNLPCCFRPAAPERTPAPIEALTPPSLRVALAGEAP
jgi:hypothetical protein